MKLILILLFITTSFEAYSNTRVGNGGFAILCENKIEILDNYQARKLGNNISTIPGSNLEDKIYFLLKKLEILDPNRAKNYRFLFERDLKDKLTFIQIDGLRLNSTQVANKELQEQFGLGNISIPKECELILVAHQSYDQYKVLLNIYQPSWDLLTPDDQASLILHELFYREAIKRNLNSVPVRALNGLLTTDEFNSMNMKGWSEKLKKENFIDMFPEFYNESQSLNLENISPLLNNYIFNSNTSFSGQYSICDKLYKISSKSGLFYDGLVPQRFLITDEKLIDFSCLGKFKFKIYNNESFLISLKRSINPITNKLTVRVEETSQGYLSELTHPQINFSGPILAQIDDDSIELIRTDFSILQVNINGKWQNINSLTINLKSGKIN